MVYDAMQKLVEESQQELGQQNNLLGEVPNVAESSHSNSTHPDQTNIWQLLEIIHNKLLQKMEVCRTQPISIYSGQYTYFLSPFVPSSPS